MAGYVFKGSAVPPDQNPNFEFHIDNPNLIEHIGEKTENCPVLTFQVDGDELDAVFHGFETHKKVGMVGFRVELETLIKKYKIDEDFNAGADLLGDFLFDVLLNSRTLIRKMNNTSTERH